MNRLPNGELYYTKNDVDAAVDVFSDYERPNVETSPIVERLNLPVKSQSEIVMMMNPGK